MELIAEFFRQLAEDHPRWNFIWMYEPLQQAKILKGIWVTIQLSLACLVFSVIIGVLGAFMQGSRNVAIRMMVQGYIQFFRNTPPYVQLLFFYFALGQLTPTYSPDGWLEIPIISNVGWAIISLSFFAGAFNIEIFRAGIEAVPESTREASSSLGFSRGQTFRYIVFPLALRVALPAPEQQSCQSGQDDNPGFRHCRARVAVSVGHDLERLSLGTLPHHVSCLYRLHTSGGRVGGRHEFVGEADEDSGLWRLDSRIFRGIVA